MMEWSIGARGPEGARAGLWNAVAALQLAAILVAGTTLALYWDPQPYSDWLYYWDAAGDVHRYERGGLSLWLLSIPKLMGAGPAAAALWINIPAATLLCWLAYRADGSRWKLFAQALTAYLFLLSPFIGIVQLDMVAAAELAVGFWLLLDPRIPLSSRQRHAFAVVALMFAVSTKPQYALVLWALLGLSTVAMLSFRRRPEGFATACVVLLLGSMLGFGVDMGLRQASGRTEQIRTSSAVTLYGGLLVSSERREERCGYWTMEAARAARRDLRKPLVDAIVDRLQAQPPAHWMGVLRCKAPEILRPPPYALYWLIESPNVRARLDASGPRIAARFQRALALERRLYGGLTAVILAMGLWAAVRWRRRIPGWSALAALWILSFWGVHAIFEIQGRYFLGMFVLAPLLCSLARQRAPLASAGAHAPAAGAGAALG